MLYINDIKGMSLMKCKNQKCKKFVSSYHVNRNMLYCSAKCSPLAGLKKIKTDSEKINLHSPAMSLVMKDKRMELR